MLYYHGYGVQQNYRAAHKWFNLAAQQELPDAQYMLGLTYYLSRVPVKTMCWRALGFINQPNSPMAMHR